MKLQQPFVITIIGPESSGKTTLARKLAQYFGCPWVPEYAREYLEKLGRDYDEGDLTKIAEGQFKAIQQFTGITEPLLNSDFFQLALEDGQKEEWPNLKFYREDFGTGPRPILVVDSGMLTLKLWARIKYGTQISFVEKALEKDNTSLYIVCRPVLPWEPDPLREAPTMLERAWIYNQYLKELSMLQVK